MTLTFYLPYVLYFGADNLEKRIFGSLEKIESAPRTGKLKKGSSALISIIFDIEYVSSFASLHNSAHNIFKLQGLAPANRSFLVMT